jgi:PhnB protein
VTLNIYVEDADATFERAVAAGAKPLQRVDTQFYGDRIGWFQDPWGHRWGVATHVEDVSPEKLTERIQAMVG